MKRKEHERLLALFAIAIVSQLPSDLGARIASHLDEMGAMALRDGDTTVGTAARELAHLVTNAAAMARQDFH